MAAPHTGPQSALLAWLESGEPLGNVARRIDTHGAHVLLTGDRAWKLKRAVRYDYLDFSTPALRHEALEAELRLNRRTAPDLYLSLHPVTRDADGKFALGGDGEPVEWLLEMRRFPDDALLDDLATHHELDTPLLLALADRIGALHGAVERDTRGDGAARMRAILDGNARSFADVADVIPPEQAAALDKLQRAEINRHAEQLDARARNGRVRHGHGDLHLRNIALIDGAPVLFDCLEFDAELATVDILYDLAFLLMDLWFRGLRTEANIVANRYLDVSPQGASGYGLLPLFLSVRAAIRAHVAAAAAKAGDTGKAAEARGYCGLAVELLMPLAPEMVAVGGLSGTGKSTLARQLGAWIGRAPGARVLRSDVFRKRLAGVSPETRLPPESYTAASSDRTYEALFESAEDHLRCGTSVILDAVFSSRAEREIAQIIAERERVPFHGIWLEAPEQERVARVSGRSADASDASAAVVREQSRKSVGDLGGWLRLRANRPLVVVAQAARSFLDRRRR